MVVGLFIQGIHLISEFSSQVETVGSNLWVDEDTFGYYRRWVITL